MDNAFVIDGVLLAVLIGGTLLGARRGAVKSLMGLVTVAAALLGAVMFAELLTGPVTAVVAPKVEDAVVGRFFEEHGSELPGEWSDTRVGEPALDALRELGVPEATINGLTSKLHVSSESVKQEVADAVRAAVSEAVRALVRTMVHAALVLVFYLALLVALKLLTRALDLVFDLPVLGTVNGALGALLGFAEAALLLFVAVHIAARLNAGWAGARAPNAYLLPLFLDHSPVEWISAWFH